MKQTKPNAASKTSWLKSEMSSKDRCFVVETRDGVVIGDIAELHYQSSRPKEVQIANARLMSAAPELLAALEMIHAGFIDGSIKWAKPRVSDSDPYHPANTAMSEAFAKAKGH